MRTNVSFSIDNIHTSNCPAAMVNRRIYPSLDGVAFGQFRDPRHDKKAKKWDAVGFSYISDEVYPYVYVVPKDDVADVEQFDDRMNFKEGQKRGVDLFLELGFNKLKDNQHGMTHPKLGKQAFMPECILNRCDEYRVCEMIAAELLSHSLGRDTLQRGHLFSVSVADGYAAYLVTKVNKKTVQVEWRGFCCDNYVDQIMGHGCKIERSHVEAMCLRTSFCEI